MTDDNPHLKKLVEIVRSAVAEIADIDECAASVLDTVARSNPLRRELQAWAWEQAVRSLIYEARHHAHTNLKFGTPAGTIRGAEAIAASAAACDRALLRTWRMPDGRVLGAWMPAELRRESEHESRIAEGHRINAAFYAGLADLGVEDEAVGDRIAERDAAALLDRIIRESRGQVA